MAKDTKISWAGSTLNVGIGCERVSAGCRNCYAEELVGRYAGQPGWPRTFQSGIWKPEKLADIEKWARQGGRRIFVNSLSDVHWRQFNPEQVESLYDAMLAQPAHDYLVLTKRPQRMADFFLGREGGFAGKIANELGMLAEDGWLARRGLTEVPPWIWLGTSIESNQFVGRADHLRRIPAAVRFISAEPLLGYLSDLDLTGIAWIIVGGESGKDHRHMDLHWAHDLAIAARATGTAFLFKQASDYRPGQRPDALGEVIEEFPLPHPALGLERRVGIYTDPDMETAVTINQGQGRLL